MSIQKNYTDHYKRANLDQIFPNESIIRIFRGNYPNLNLRNIDLKDKKILDMGFGDGRNLNFFNQLGLNVHGTEITQEICDFVFDYNKQNGFSPTLKAGLANNLPFDDEQFDFVVSWSSCYYMGEAPNHFKFEDHLKEFNRVLKPGGLLIFMIPMKSSFLFEGSDEFESGYVKITDRYGVRNNQIMRRFEDKTDLINTFSDFFTDLKLGQIYDDIFGENVHSYLGVCKKP